MESSGAGSLTKRPYKGGYRWCGQVRHKDAAGKWKTTLKALTDAEGNAITTDADEKDPDTGRKVRTTRNIRKARAALARWRESLLAPTMHAATTATVADYYADALDARAGALEPSTMRGYREYEKYFRDGLAGVQMADLDPERVREWVRWMIEQGHKPNTIRKAFNLLATTCDRAEEAGDIQKNPCIRSIRRDHLPSTAGTAPNAIPAADLARANAMITDAKNPRVRVGARIALHMGLRAGEVCALRWRDLDADGLAVTVRAAIGNAGAGADAATYVKTPKSRASARTVPTTPTVRRELAEWRETQRADYTRAWEAQEDAAPPFDDCFILGFADGRHMTPRALGREWCRVADGQRLRDPADRRRHAEGYEPDRGPLMGTQGKRVTFHDLRHTFATHAIAAGADVKSVSALLGHADAALTLNVYADSDPEARTRAMERAAAILDREGTAAEGEKEPAQI